MSPTNDMRWAITNHVCRVCFGRVLATATSGTPLVTYRCSYCGTERQGETESVICSCGLKLRTGSDMGIRCAVNDNKTPDCIGEVIAMQVNPL